MQATRLLPFSMLFSQTDKRPSSGSIKGGCGIYAINTLIPRALRFRKRLG